MPPSVSADKLMKRARRSNVVNCFFLFIPFSLSEFVPSVSSQRHKALQILHNATSEDGSVVCERLQGATFGSIGGITHCSQREDPITTYVHSLSFSHAV